MTAVRRPVLLVVPTLGTRPAWLRDTLWSIAAQRGTCDVFIRVVAPRSASLDGVLEGLEVEVLRSDRPGLSAAINDGWADRAGFDYLGWLGDDDLLAPYSLERAVAALEHDEGAAAAYGRVRYIDGEGSSMWLQRPGRLAAPYLRWGKNLVPQQGSLFRSSAVDEVGGLDESLRSAMDQDLFTRLRSYGRLRYVAAELAAFRLHDTSITMAKGTAGADESEALRAMAAPAGYRCWRPMTRVLDRGVYAIMRRLPQRTPAEWTPGVPYTAPGAARTAAESS